MANIAFNFNPGIESFPFDLVPYYGSALERTSLPRARIHFRAQAETVTAKIATNSSSIRVNAVLPVNYAYVFEYATLNIDIPTNIADADNFSNNGQIQFSNGDGTGARIGALFSRGLVPDLLQAGSQKIWHPVNPYRTIMYNVDGIAPQIFMEIWDNELVLNTDEGNFSSYLSVLQYDIEQIYNVSVNAPIPVTPRG